MVNSKTIEVIKKYYSIIETKDTSNESYEFIKTFEIELAKAILNEFCDNSANKLGQILLICSNVID